MKILAVDTATTSCSAGLAADGRLVAETTLESRETHSKHVLQMVSTVLEMSRLTLADVDGFAVSHGPGSFTGLRIGISTLMGLAHALHKPLVGVSTLAALGLQAAGQPLPVSAMIDARRGEVYCCCYTYCDQGLTATTAERVAAPAEAAESIPGPCLFVGNGARLYRQLIEERLGDRALFAPLAQDTIRAGSVAFLGAGSLGSGSGTRIDVKPHYIRKSDAEIKALPKLLKRSDECRG